MCVWEHFGKLLFQNMPPHTHTHTQQKKSFSFLIALQRPHWSSSSFGGSLGGLVGRLSVTVVSGSIRTSPPGVGIWRLVAAIECVKIIVNFSDTHHTSMGRLSATPCQGQWHGGSEDRGVCVCVQKGV